MVSHITLLSLLSLLPLSGHSLRIQPVPPFPSITPGAQGVITWERNTGGPESKDSDPDNWHFEFAQNGAQIGSDIPVPHHGAASGTMTLTVPSDATAGPSLQLLAVDGQATTAFATFPIGPPGQPPNQLPPPQDKDPDPSQTALSTTTSNNGPPDTSDANSETSSTTITSSSAPSISLSISSSSSSSVIIGNNGSTASETGSSSFSPTASDDQSSNTGIAGDAAPTASTPSTTNTAATDNHHSNRAAIIADIVIGIVILLLLLTSLYFFWRRRALKRQRHISFHRDMMIRRNSDTPIPLTGSNSASAPNKHILKLKDSQGFKFELLSSSAGVEIGVTVGNGGETKTVNEKDKVMVDLHCISSSLSSTGSSTSSNETASSLAMSRYSYSSRDHILATTKEEIRSPATTSSLTTLSSERESQFQLGRTAKWISKHRL